MFKPKESSQNEYGLVSIDELIPDVHLPQLLINILIVFSFLHEKVRSYYSDDNGLPADPLILFKMMIIGYFYGIRSERHLERDIRTIVVFRWFLGLKFKKPVSHHSTIS